MHTSQNTKQFKAGETVIHQGDEGSCAYIIEKGRVEILIEKEKGLVQSIGSRGPGSIVGEMAIIDNEPRTASVKALEDSELLEISRQDFEKKLNNTDPIMQMVMRVILARYRDTHQTRTHFRKPANFATIENQEKHLVEQTNALETIKIGNEFKEALNNKDLSLHYQPIIDIKTSKIIGFEALMRWNHPQKGYISPNIFIPIIEENGFIVEASRWALRESCEALVRIQKKYAPQNKLFMSINFSSLDIVEPSFEKDVQDILKETKLDADQIHIEITERLLMDEPEEAKNTLEACKKIGTSISIDDFRNRL